MLTTVSLSPKVQADTRTIEGYEVRVYTSDDVIPFSLRGKQWTKVYRTLVHDNEAIPAQWQAVVDAEAELWTKVRKHLDEQGIAYIDALPALQQCLRDGRAPFHIDIDGHPNAVGHKVIAELLASDLLNRSSN